MKIKIRPDDVGAPGGNEWAEMNGWLAELRDDSAEGPVMDGQRGPADDRQRGPVDGRRGPVDARQQDPADGSRESPVDGRQGDRAGKSPARPAGDTPARPARPGSAAPPAGAPVRAVIGDELRMPIMWCEMDSCISWHADRTALGEADVRARAIRAGWRIDALGRLACPQCQQTKVAFRATRPVVLWDRATAIAMAARATAPDAVRPGRRARAGAPGLPRQEAGPPGLPPDRAAARRPGRRAVRPRSASPSHRPPVSPGAGLMIQERATVAAAMAGVPAAPGGCRPMPPRRAGPACRRSRRARPARTPGRSTWPANSPSRPCIGGASPGDAKTSRSSCPRC